MRGAILSLIMTAGFGFSIPALAQTEPVELTERQVKRLSGKLCRTLSRYAETDQDVNIEEKIEETLLKYSGIDSIQSDYKAKIARFWNINSSNVICKPNVNDAFPEQHFFSRAILQDFPISVFKNYFFRDNKNFPINPNIVIVNQHGSRETILDYIDSILLLPDVRQRYNIHQIREVRDIIANDFGGKRFRELP